MNCSPWICSVEYPDIPFGPWPLWGYDVLRTACVAGGLLTFVLTILALGEHAHGASWGQQSRWLAALMFTISVVGTEMEHLGDLASWRLVVNLLAVAGNLYGLLHFLRHEYVTEPR